MDAHALNRAVAADRRSLATEARLNTAEADIIAAGTDAVETAAAPLIDQAEAARDAAQAAEDGAADNLAGATALMGPHLYTTTAAGDAAVAEGAPYILQGDPGGPIIGTIYRKTAGVGVSTGLEIIARKALDVIAERFVPGKNLFNKATATVGYYLGHNNTAPVADATFDYSDFIPVTSGQQYYGRAGTGLGMRFVTYYDASKVFVSGGLSDGGNPGIVTFTPPAGVAFVRVTVYHAGINLFQLEKGAAGTPFQSYRLLLGGPLPIFSTPQTASVSTEALIDAAVAPGKTSFLTLGKNLFDKATATVGGYISPSNNNFVSGATWDCSDYIPVTPGQVYRAQGAAHGLRFVAFYDFNKALIPDPNNAEATTFTAVTGAAYVRVTLWHADLDSFQVELGAAQTGYEAFGYRFTSQVTITSPDGSITSSKLANGAVTTDKIGDDSVTPAKSSFLSPGKNLFNKATATVGYFRGHDNSTVVSATFSYSDYIAVAPGQQLVSNSGMRFTTFYAANKAFVSGGSSAETTAITVPAGVYFVIVTVYTTTLSTFQLETGAVATGYEAFGYRLNSEVVGLEGLLSGWSGKTWASLGDSITANPTWQPLVARSLGLSFSNFGAGGTRISGPNGDANSMCQDARINAIPTTVDLITLMGGTNDWAQSIALGAEDSLDPTTFHGALNTFAAKALARWPSKRVALASTPYGELTDWATRSGWTSAAKNSIGLTTNDYAEAIRKAASRLNLALIDVARNGGWGATNIQTYLGGSTSDHLHPTGGSPAALGIAAAHRGAFRQIEPVAP